jgi:hypothetical protein
MAHNGRSPGPEGYKFGLVCERPREGMNIIRRVLLDVTLPRMRSTPPGIA